jgi:hypothetical protein
VDPVNPCQRSVIPERVVCPGPVKFHLQVIVIASCNGLPALRVPIVVVRSRPRIKASKHAHDLCCDTLQAMARTPVGA